MANTAEKRDERTCAGCGTPMWFLRGERKFSGKVYHPNCVPSASRSEDAEYYKGIQDGWRYYQNKQTFGQGFADDTELAREMREAGVAVDDPTPPARKRKPVKKASEMTGDECRDEYRTIRKRSSAPSAKAFDEACRKLLSENTVASPTPQQWVMAARKVTFACRRCGGTGKFVTMVENGQPKGPGGPCYRCNGKGYRDDRDERRNYGYDVFYRRY